MLVPSDPAMPKFLLSSVLVFFVSCFPLASVAQDTTSVDVDALAEALNDQCPINYDDDWSINSFTMVEDRYALVDVMLPANLSMVLGMLTGDGYNVKRVWIKQLTQYGKQWNDFVDAMVGADRRVVVNLRPAGSKETALITFMPADFQRYFSSDK